MEQLVSNREFARRVGVNEANIRQYITAGNFSTNAFGVDTKGRKKLNWPEAKKEWDAFGGGSKKELPSNPNAGTELVEDDLPEIAESRRANEYYRAMTAKIEYQKEKGELMLRAEVEAQLFEAGANVRKALQSVPDVCVDSVMAASTRHEAHSIMYKAIEDALFSLTGLSKVLDKEPSKD